MVLEANCLEVLNQDADSTSLVNAQTSFGITNDPYLPVFL
jgi:hypothetical protein